MARARGSSLEADRISVLEEHQLYFMGREERFADRVLSRPYSCLLHCFFLFSQGHPVSFHSVMSVSLGHHIGSKDTGESKVKNCPRSHIEHRTDARTHDGLEGLGIFRARVGAADVG